MRPLVLLLTLILTLAVSGISSAAIASSTGDDCCGAARSADTSEVQNVDTDDHRDADRDRCPPLCHKCACSPTFSVPELGKMVTVTLSLDSQITYEKLSQLPVSPPRAGVFHPPRHTR